MIARLPEIPAGQTCDPKAGWLPDHFHDQCREIANKYVQQQAKKVFIEERERIRSIKTIDETDSAHKREAVQTSDDEDRIVIDGKRQINKRCKYTANAIEGENRVQDHENVFKLVIKTCILFSKL